MSSDVLGRSYSATRATDPRIAAAIWDALGETRTVVNVGGGQRQLRASGPRSHGGRALRGDDRPAPAGGGAGRAGVRFAGRLWVSAEYFPELIAEEARDFPSLADQAGAQQALSVTPVLIPYLLALEELDLGYRLLVSAAGAAPCGA